MALFEQVLLSSFPWTLGTLLTVGVARLQAASRTKSPRILLSAGIGGPIGYLVFAAILNTGAGDLFFDKRNIALIKVLSGLQFAALLYLAWSSWRHWSDISLSGKASFAAAYLFLFWLAGLGTLAYFVWWLPVLGYDVLDHWAVKAHQLIMQLQPDGTGRLENMHRHPNTLRGLLAWNAWTAEAAGGNNFILLPWLLMTLSLQVALVAFSILVSGSTALGLLLAMGAVTVPLMENHVLLAGYAELPITVFLSLSCALIAAGILERRMDYQVLGAMLALALISFKGSGVLYALLPLMGLLLTYCYEGSRAYKYFFLGLLVAGCCLVIFAVVFQVNGNLYGFDGLRFRAFGWRTGLTDVTAAEIARNIIYAYGINSSFSLLIIIFMAAASLSFSGHLDRSALFLILTISVGLIILAATQLTSYGFRHARVGFDTGNSRFSLPVVMLVWLIIPYVYRVANKLYDPPTRSE